MALEKPLTIGLVGNPNCGKTTLFNGLTGSHQHIGNWPGVTVEKKEGSFQLPDGTAATLVDLPGIYSLTAASEDEAASLSYILSHEADFYINVLDATTLERNLYLTLLLCELHVPMVIAVTMVDIAEQRGIDVDLKHLAGHLGVPVVGVNATRPKDVERLLATLASVAKAPPTPPNPVVFPNELEDELAALGAKCGNTAALYNVSPRWVARKALECDPLITARLRELDPGAVEEVPAVTERTVAVLKDPPDIVFAETRYGIIGGLVRDVVHVRKQKVYWSEIIDSVVLNRFLGLPLFLAIMAGVFALVELAGGMPTGFFEALGSIVFISLPQSILASLHAPEWLFALVTGGIGSALVTIFSFVPVMFCMFFALSILEDSGYMSRAAFLADRFMGWMGLPGKSFVPLLVGFGCSVPAIMAVRTLESKRDRLLTIFMIPFMSCGAKLPVYAAFAAAFAPEHPWQMMLALYLAGVVLGIATGLLLKRTLFLGTPSHFIMELPPYHVPRLKHILMHTWERLSGFLFRAGKFIVPMMFVLGVLNSFTVDSRFDRGFCADASTETSEYSALAAVGRTLTPIFEPIGVEKDNWPASVAVFTGLFAKESVIGTLYGLYGQDKEMQMEGRLPEEDRMENVMRRHFPRGFHQAFSYLLFILLYVPCVGATGVALKELGTFYGALFISYLTLLGWSVATVYHAVTVSHSVLWLSVGAGILVAMFGVFALIGRKRKVDMV